MGYLTFDVETTTKNKGNPFTASNKLVCYSVQKDDHAAECHYYNDIEFVRALREHVVQAKWLIGFNIKFDLHWARRVGVTPPNGCRVWDCQIAEFILRGQQGSMPSLNEALTRFDLGQKDDKVAEYWALGVDTTDIPVDELKFYCNRDVELTYKLYLSQLAVMTDKQKRLCTVMGLDLLVLQEMEWNGIKFDTELCKRKADETAKELKEVSDELLAMAPRPDFNFGSGHQLSCWLYGGSYTVDVVENESAQVYKSGIKKGQSYIKTTWRTEEVVCPGIFVPLKGSQTKLVSKVGEKEYPIYATGEDVLKQLKKPTKTHRRIVELLLALADKEKLLSTYYAALPNLLEKMEWGDTLHGQYNQVVARTGRLSSSNPNMQNFSGPVDELLVSRF